MWHFSSSFRFFLFLFLIPHNHKTSPICAESAGVIDQTCQICANGSPEISYSFCLTSLQAIPISHFTNLQGLAVIAMELAIQNATHTIYKIKQLLDGGPFDPFAIKCLEDCSELYLDTVMTLVNAISAFLSEQYKVANDWVRAAMEAASTCEGGFAKKEEMSPLTKENYNLFQLCDIALCIIHLLTQASLPS